MLERDPVVLESLDDFKRWLAEFVQARPSPSSDFGLFFWVKLSGGPDKNELVEVSILGAETLARLAYSEGYRIVAQKAIQSEADLYRATFMSI